MMPTPVVQATDCRNGFHTYVGRNAKARLGEALVRHYFELAGWSVTPTGVEDVVDHLSSIPNVNRGDLSSLPDFLMARIASPRSDATPNRLGQAFYVEVKTHRRWPADEDFSKYLRWGHVLMVWVSPQGLLGAWLSKPGGESPKGKLRPEDFQPLALVGTVSIGHCADSHCEARLRIYFDDLAKTLAEMET
ncbi:MAG: hypothetical protein ACYC2H_01135 [Thermoplasmatota archaeon]